MPSPSLVLVPMVILLVIIVVCQGREIGALRKQVEREERCAQGHADNAQRWLSAWRQARRDMVAFQIRVRSDHDPILYSLN